MKKFLSIIVILTVLFTSVFAISTSAASASATLTGPDTVRAGDKITLTFNLNGSGILGASGTLSYDSNQLTLSGTSQKIGSPWVVEFNGNNFVAYDNNLSNPISSNKALFTVTFTVKSNVAAGSQLKVSYTNVKASDGNADANIGTVAYSKTVAAPMSSDNNLASLTVNNATISPAFSASTTSYTASVPFEVSKLNVSATAADGKAKVSVNSPNLTPNGTTKVTVTVTAENGSKKTYTISVKRAQDPNYQASSNNKLSGICIDGFLLSPVFNADVDQYLVWLPYETDRITVSGTSQDNKASVEVIGGENLAAGQDNKIKIICTAENGNKKTYTLIAKRAAAHDGSVDEKPAEPTTPEDTSTPPVTSKPTTPDAPSNPVAENSGIEWYWLLVVGIAAIAAGMVVGILIGKKKK